MLYLWYIVVSIGMGALVGGIFYVSMEHRWSRRARKLFGIIIVAVVATTWFNLSHKHESKYNNGYCYECNDKYEIVNGTRDEGRRLYRCPSCSTQTWH